MTQPTIKENMFKTIEIIQELQTEFMRALDAENGTALEMVPRIVKKSDEAMKDFARLICEEMTGEKMLETSGNTKSFDEGYNARVTEEKQKAQEILKALE